MAQHDPTDAEFAEWDRYFESQDLGELEDVRDYVGMHVMQNCFDIPKDTDFLTVARMTLEGYIEDVEFSRDIFNGYRSIYDKK